MTRALSIATPISLALWGVIGLIVWSVINV